MHNKELFWIILFNTTNEKVVLDQLKAIEKLIGPFEVISNDSYWKVKTNRRVEIRQVLSYNSQGLTHVLNKLSLIGQIWNFVLPRDFDFHNDNLSIIAESKFHLINVEWINVELKSI